MPSYRSLNPALAALERIARISQCASCGEAGQHGSLVVRWDGRHYTISCNDHGDNPRTRPIDHEYETRKRHGMKAVYGETRDTPMEREEREPGEVPDCGKDVWG